MEQGVQSKLDALFETDAMLRRMITKMSSALQLRPGDVYQCGGRLYQMACAEPHGADCGEVSACAWPPAERAALCALFERFGVDYVYFADGARAPSASPYSAAAVGAAVKARAAAAAARKAAVLP